MAERSFDEARALGLKIVTDDGDGTGSLNTSGGGGGGGGDASAANQVLQIVEETAINTRIGEVQASPTANTLLDRLKTLATSFTSLFALIGEVQASPTSNTVLDRLKQLLTNAVPKKGTKTSFGVGTQPDTTARVIFAANSSRICAVIQNNHATNSLYLGKDNTVTASIGGYMVCLPPGAVLVDNDSSDAWWGITSTGTAAVSGYEVA